MISCYEANEEEALIIDVWKSSAFDSFMIYTTVYMGKILVLLRYVFLIYSVDINESKRHIHVTHNVAGYKKSCKFWLEPEVLLDENKKGDFTEIELREIGNLIEENKELILQQLDLFYQGKPVKSIRK